VKIMLDIMRDIKYVINNEIEGRTKTGRRK